VAEIQSLARGLKLLDLLSKSQQGVGITEAAAWLAVDKSSALRLLQTLAQYGFAQKDSGTRKYALGTQLVNLSRFALARIPLRESARPFLLELVKLTGECAHLGVVCKDGVLYIDQVESPATLRVNTEVGQTAPLHCTALGKVFLAFGLAEIPTQLESFTEHTIIDSSDLAVSLEKIRKQGFAEDHEEYNEAVRCLAAPIFDFRERVIGSLGISGPSSRLTLPRMRELSDVITNTAQNLSARMGFKTGKEE
jgi:IclR family KDG regulon transcriptional repressor